MRFYKPQIMTGLVLVLLLGPSCKKFVQISAPNTKIVTASVFDNTNAITSAILGIYIDMFNNKESFNMAQNQGLLSDELTNYAINTLSKVQFYTNSMLAINNNGNWTSAYNYIYQANALIAGLRNNGNVIPTVAQQIVGEAKFIRAFWYFYLTNMYGDVPLVTTTDYAVNMSIGRTAQAQVYSQVIQDLKDAESLLNANYVDASDTAITADRVRPTKGAAEAMLARVYLFTHQYDSAAQQATLVINNSNLYVLDSIRSPTNSTASPNSPFLKNSTEAIWQLYTPVPSSQNTIDAQYFILSSAPSGGTAGSNTISPELLNTFEPGDLRMSDWIGQYSKSGSPSYYFPYKYRALNTGTIAEYTMVLRLAEQFLIRAEAMAEQNNASGAIADLNVIRNRAGLNSYAGATDQASLLAAILHERQVELFTEWGHRWFDLIRTNNINAVMNVVTPMKSNNSVLWNTNDILYPIPQSEIMNDNRLTQNSGY